MVHEGHSQMMQELQERTKREEYQVKVAKINRYLAGSPMSGLGDWIVTEAGRTGCNPFLCPAQATAESSNGVQNCGSYNPFGMLGMSFGSWRDAVTHYFDNIVAHWGPVQSIYQMPGYCVPDHPYMENVQGIVDAIERIEL